MDIPYVGGSLLDIAGVEARATQPKRSPCLAFLMLTRTTGTGDTQQTNSRPLNYAGPSNKSYVYSRKCMSLDPVGSCAGGR